MKFLKGFLFGASIASMYTLLTTTKSGKERQNEWQKPLTQTKETLHHIQHVKSAVTTLQKTQIPQALHTVKAIQKSVQTFTTENQPRFKRIQRKLEKLQEDIRQLSSEKENETSTK